MDPTQTYCLRPRRVAMAMTTSPLVTTTTGPVPGPAVPGPVPTTVSMVMGDRTRTQLKQQDSRPPRDDRVVPAMSKLTLAFVLNNEMDAADDGVVTGTVRQNYDMPTQQQGDYRDKELALATDRGTASWASTSSTTTRCPKHDQSADATKNSESRQVARSTVSSRPPMSKEQKRLSRQCKIPDCENYIINKGLCFRHGGGKQCEADGCTSSAKNHGLCWKHGGSEKCTITGCKRRGKSRGVCWAHGGGTRCSVDACDKVAVSNGHCWAHGGGKRCVYDGCTRAAFGRTHNYCNRHYLQIRDGESIIEV